jgi:hypothetical protein
LPRNEVTTAGPIPESRIEHEGHDLLAVRVSVLTSREAVAADHAERTASAANLVEHKAVSPRHYETLVPQPIQVINAWKLNFYFANTIKYVARYGDTGNLDDVKKAKRYLEFFINSVERGDPLADPV